jgi:MFS family permease
MQEFFELQAIFGITVALMEIPTGYICDVWGRRVSLLIGTFLNALSFLLLSIAKNYQDLLIYELLCAVAMTFVSGADVSMLFDSAAEQTKESRVKALGNMQLASTSGEASASILGGFLATFSLKTAAMGSAISAWLPFLIALTFDEPPTERMEKGAHRKNVADVIKFITTKSDRFFRVIFVNTVVWNLSTFCAVWTYQKYWILREIPVGYFGILWAGYNLSAGMAGRQVLRLGSFFSEVLLTLAIFVLPILGYFGMSISNASWGVFFGFLFYLSRGINGVILRAHLNEHTPAKMRATVNSLQSLCMRLGFGLIGPATGWGIDHFGMDLTLRALGGFFVVMMFVVGIPLLRLGKPNK